MFPRRRTYGATRLSDAERERALEVLKVHYARGRLSAAQLEARVGDVFRVRTRRELALQLRGLPLLGFSGLVVGWVRRAQRAVLRAHAALYATLNASLVGIWALTGEGVFWPAWLLIPSTALLAWHLFASRALTRALTRRGW